MGVALELLGVGMITVFVILALVVIIGNLIIIVVNKYIGEEIRPLAKTLGSSDDEISPKKLAVIASAVNVVTKGTGHVVNVKKL